MRAVTPALIGFRDMQGAAVCLDIEQEADSIAFIICSHAWRVHVDI